MNQPPYPPPYPPQPPYQPFGPRSQPGGYGAPPMGPPIGPPQQSFAPPPPPPPRKSSAGKIIAIIAAVLVVLLALGGFFVWRAVSGVVNSVSGIAGGAGANCAAVSTQDVDAVLGGDWTVFQLGGLSSIAGPTMDSRVLPDAPTSCWATQDKDGKLTRIARYQGADAAAKFAQEKQKAKGTTVDQGNGLSVSSDSYLGKDVQAGDEAFCTTGDFLASAGALVRHGDTLVYVSTTAAGDGAASPPDVDLNGSSTTQTAFGTDDANCALAVKLIEKVH